MFYLCSGSRHLSGCLCGWTVGSAPLFDINKAWPWVSPLGPGYELVNHMLMFVVSSCSWNSRLDILELSPIC